MSSAPLPPTPKGGEISGGESLSSTTINNTIRLIRTYSEAASALPIGSGDDYEYHSAFTDFGPSMERHAASCKVIVDTFSRAMISERRSRQRLATSSSSADSGDASSKDALFGVVDTLFEDIDTILDDLKGSTYRTDLQTQLNQAQGVSESGERIMPVFAPSTNPGPAAVVVPRPQLQFERAVDNSDAAHFPLIFSEPKGELRRAPEAHIHPHDDLLREYPLNPRQLRHRAEEVSAPVDTTPLHLVGTLEELDAMIAELSAPAPNTATATTTTTTSTSAFESYLDFAHTGIQDMFQGANFNTFVPKHREIAIDLEHHDLHSFQGITCLCQISTRTDDYLVDVIALRSFMYRMNRFLLNPKIVKVLHGCREDVRWFQKDFGCYISNIFDTGAALQAMRMPYSLAFAVDHFCQVKLDKKYQLADWRQRPLSAEMVKYARLDTHYLLYIHDRLTNNLIGFESKTAIGNVLLHVLEEGRRLCRLVYDMPRLDAKDGFREALGRSLVGMRPLQLEVTRRVFNWRDRVARQDDESPLAVMHPASVIQLGLRCGQLGSGATTVPASLVLGVVKPVSMTVRVHLTSLLEAIAGALTSDVATADGGDATRVVAAPSSSSKAERESELDAAVKYQPTHCPQTGTLPSVSGCIALSTVQTPTGYTLPATFTVVEHQRKKIVGGGKRARSTEGEEVTTTTATSGQRTATVAFYRLLAQRIPPPSSLRAAAALQSQHRKPIAVTIAEEEPAAVVPQAAAAAAAAVEVVEEETFMALPDAPVEEEAADSGTADSKEKQFKSIRQEYGGLGRDQRRRQQQQPPKK